MGEDRLTPPDVVGSRVNHGRYIAGTARVGVLPPHATEIVHGVEHLDILEFDISITEQDARLLHTADSCADDDDPATARGRYVVYRLL